MITTEWERCQAALVGNIDNDEEPVILEPITSVSSVRTWDYSLPTLTQKRRFTSRKTFTGDNGNEDFIDVIKEHGSTGLTYGILETIGVFNESTDIVLYGGALLDILLHREHDIHDWDLRLIGTQYIDNEILCMERTKGVVGTIFQYLRDENKRRTEQNQQWKREGNTTATPNYLIPLQKVQTSRRYKTITIIIPPHGNEGIIRFQLTFEPYGNISQLLAHCSPHCCRIAIQDNTVWVDQAAKYCIESLCIVMTADSIKDWINQEETTNNDNDKNNDKCDPAKNESDKPSTVLSLNRLKKYFNKGFDIILPDLDITKVPVRNIKFKLSEVLDLPFCAIIYDTVSKNKIMVSDIQLPTGGSVLKNGYNDTADDDDVNKAIDVGNSIHYNIRCLVNNVYDKFVYVAEGEDYVHVLFDPVPQITRRMIDKSYETVYDHLVNGDTNLIDTIAGYFYATSPADVVEELYVKPLRNNGTTTAGGTNTSNSSTLPKSFELDKKKLEEFIEKEKESLITTKVATLPEKVKELYGNGLALLTPPPSPTEVVTKPALLEALYGKYKNLK